MALLISTNISMACVNYPAWRGEIVSAGFRTWAPHVFHEKADREGTWRAHYLMDPKIIQGKVDAFAQRLLVEASGDPMRALGLLVLVLDTVEFQSIGHMKRLIATVRKVLMPEEVAQVTKPIRHLVGDVSWEGVQHCLRCGKVLIRNGREPGPSLPPGYVFEIGTRFTSEACDDFSVCA